MKNDGGAAFPHKPSKFIYNGEGKHPTPLDNSGMSLRDYMAGQALVGLLAHHGYEGDPSKYAYDIADQMIKARGE